MKTTTTTTTTKNKNKKNKKTKQNKKKIRQFPIYSNLTIFFIDSKLLKYSYHFKIAIFQFHSKSEHKQVKSNKIKQDTCKSNSIFPCLQSFTIFQ